MVQRITIKPQQIQGSVMTLESDQTHYLTRVLRLTPGHRFIAQDGQGQQWEAALTERPNQATIIKTLATRNSSAGLSGQLSAPLRLVAALPKGNSFDQVVRQATELGVTHIYPVLSERTLLKPSSQKLARWQRIAEEASEQSERLTVPKIYEPVTFQQCLEQPVWEPFLAPQSELEKKDPAKKEQQDPPKGTESTPDLKYLCIARQGTQTPHLLAHLLSQKAELSQKAVNLSPVNLPGVVLAIGPEGGWTSDEITDAIKNGYEAVTLGSAILRSVTAPITALSLVTAARETLI